MEEFLGLLFTLLSAGLGLMGVKLLVPLVRNGRFARGRTGVRTVGECVDMRWTSGGWVSGIVAYEDEDGERRLASTGAHPVVPVGIGETAEVRYDPRGRAAAVVNGEMPPRGVYVLGLVPIGVGLAFGAIGVHYLSMAI
ncbi:hypothetical protein IQ279_03995 [Streptomyces verrucosisporus]|uniref:DUF3592 domain-containing protein n=1 Tax=Streptomyces verrucosisporus TaxID=1695161 RepID=UPI0019D196B5|nr:DUF3592 domain-containing protein [Streptomyces verrucosisporus]MBN3928812.1 hypothetical protein [Streptomyces verrucosisporus]